MGKSKGKERAAVGCGVWSRAAGTLETPIAPRPRGHENQPRFTTTTKARKHESTSATRAEEPRVCSGMQSPSHERNTGATFWVLKRASAVVVAMSLSIGKVGAFQTAAARTRWLRSHPALVGRVHGPLLQNDVGTRSIEARPEESDADAPGFFERIGSPRFIAAPMVEQSEAGESSIPVLGTRESHHARTSSTTLPHMCML